jgi:hypothetical protein
MDSKRKVIHVFYSNSQGSRLRGQPKNRADWEKSIKEAKVHIGLQCHPRSRRRKVIIIASLA